MTSIYTSEVERVPADNTIQASRRNRSELSPTSSRHCRRLFLFARPTPHDRCRLLGSLLGMAGPQMKRAKPRVEMTLEAKNRRELLRSLVHAGAGGPTGEASFGTNISACCRCRCRCRLGRCCRALLSYFLLRSMLTILQCNNSPLCLPSCFVSFRAGDGEGQQRSPPEAAVLRRSGGPVVYGGPGEEGGHPLQGDMQAEEADMAMVGQRALVTSE